MTTVNHAKQEVLPGESQLLIKGGLFVALGIMAILISFGWFIRYPDYIILEGSVLKAVDSTNNEDILSNPGAIKNKYFVAVKLPANIITKVKIGQTVELTFQGYPSREFGYVTGKMDSFYPSPTCASDSTFDAKIFLSNELATSRNKPIIYKEGLTAEARILIGNKRAFTHVFYNLTKKL